MLAARIVAVLATLIVTQTARAYPGALDPSFGVAGVISGSLTYAKPLIASGNRVVVVGEGAGSVVRYQDSGALDFSFGSAGVAATAPIAYPTAAALQADGKILVAGDTGDRTASLIRRFEADGQPDGAFGPIVVPFTPRVMTSLADGRSIVAGSGSSASGSFIGLARYDAQGAPDPSFGVGGFVTEPDDLLILPAAMVVRDDGAVILAGLRRSAALGYTLGLARWDAAGVLDPTFGVAGVATIEFGTSPSLGVGLVRQDDGTLVVAADSGHGSANFLLAGLDADGTLDPTFGDAGLVVGPAGGFARALVQQSDGKLVVVGNGPGQSYPVRLVRYLPDGTVDGDFGIDGVSDASQGYVYGAAIDAQDRVVESGGFTRGFVARFLTDGAPLVRCEPSPGQSAECDDGDPCTWDACNLSAICTHQPVGPSPCEVDGNECTAGFCSPAGECIESVLGPVPCSDDGDPCTIDRCAVTDPASFQVGCVHAADYDFTCAQPLVPGSATLSVVDAPGTGRGDRFRFRWSHGDVTKADFGSPVSGTSYRFCAFRPTYPAVGFEVVLGARIAAAETCTESACWKERVRGWKFRSGTGDPDGVVRLALSEGGRADMGRIDVKGVGPALTLPSLPMPVGYPLSVQLHSSDGRCWGAGFYQFTRNTSVAFHARSN